jgi:hypothetical protein
LLGGAGECGETPEAQVAAAAAAVAAAVLLLLLLLLLASVAAMSSLPMRAYAMIGQPGYTSMQQNSSRTAAEQHTDTHDRHMRAGTQQQKACQGEDINHKASSP